MACHHHMVNKQIKKKFRYIVFRQKIGMSVLAMVGWLTTNLIWSDKELEFFIAQNNEGNRLPHIVQLLSYLMFILAV